MRPYRVRQPTQRYWLSIPRQLLMRNVCICCQNFKYLPNSLMLIIGGRKQSRMSCLDLIFRTLQAIRSLLLLLTDWKCHAAAKKGGAQDWQVFVVGSAMFSLFFALYFGAQMMLTVSLPFTSKNSPASTHFLTYATDVLWEYSCCSWLHSKQVALLLLSYWLLWFPQTEKTTALVQKVSAGMTERHSAEKKIPSINPASTSAVFRRLDLWLKSAFMWLATCLQTFFKFGLSVLC